MEILLIGSKTKNPAVHLVPEHKGDFLILEKFRKDYSKLMGEVCWGTEVHSVGSKEDNAAISIANISIKLPIKNFKKEGE